MLEENMLEERKLEAQQALDELFAKHLLPFKLRAHRLASVGEEEYTVYFNDSRLTCIDISWKSGESFKAVCREAVLESVKSLGGQRAEAA